MSNYEVIGNATGLKKGQIVTEAGLKETNPGLSFEKLVRNGTIRLQGSTAPLPVDPTVVRVIGAAPSDEEAKRQGLQTGQQNTKTDFPMPNAPEETKKKGGK